MHDIERQHQVNKSVNTQLNHSMGPFGLKLTFCEHSHVHALKYLLNSGCTFITDITLP